MSRVPPMKCKSHGIPECVECKKPKPHGPVSSHFMNHYYGAAKPASASDDTALLRQALDALCDFDYDKRMGAVTALRERLGETK
jgi:hypothetical protein